ncbi:hypothetical protein Stsp02_74460 [Streptomyces sp. NBRC 14336]|nr:hypothetical protein Stsp02_74460 [Streptomyces sp. NBRC 14336]
MVLGLQLAHPGGGAVQVGGDALQVLAQAVLTHAVLTQAVFAHSSAPRFGSGSRTTADPADGRPAALGTVDNTGSPQARTPTRSAWLLENVEHIELVEQIDLVELVEPGQVWGRARRRRPPDLRL